MSYLLRVALPDVPGSLGRVATAIGAVGADIEAIEIVDTRDDGTVVDDVLITLAPGLLPDGIVSACNALDGVEVLWIGRYHAGGNLFLDLEVVEELTDAPGEALDRLIGMLPGTFRADWAARLLRVDGEVHCVRATEAAPAEMEWHHVIGAERLPEDDHGAVRIAVRVGDGDQIVVGRNGGPEFLDSELARAAHLVGLAVSLSRTLGS